MHGYSGPAVASTTNGAESGEMIAAIVCWQGDSVVKAVLGNYPRKSLHWFERARPVLVMVIPMFFFFYTSPYVA